MRQDWTAWLLLSNLNFNQRTLGNQWFWSKGMTKSGFTSEISVRGNSDKWVAARSRSFRKLLWKSRWEITATWSKDVETENGFDLKVTQEVSYTGPDDWSNLENSQRKPRFHVSKLRDWWYYSLRQRYRKRGGLKEMSNKQVTVGL